MIWRSVLAFFLLTTGAAAQLVGTPVVASSGLGSGGVVTRSPWFIGGQVHLFLWTGADPENYGSFTLSLPFTLLGPVHGGPNNVIARPICVLSPSWTNPDYASGFDTPRWPPVLLWQDTYDLVAHTVSFGWAVWGQPLQPHASYSVNVICPPKVPGFSGAN